MAEYRIRVQSLLASFAVCIAFHAMAQDKVLVQSPAVYLPDVVVNTEVKQCLLDIKLAEQTLEQVYRRFPGSSPIADPKTAGEQTVVGLTITRVTGTGFGAWSGPKSMQVKVEVSEKGVPTRTILLERSTRGGAFGGYLTACAMFERVTTALGSDIARWLAQPAAGRAIVPAATEAPAAATEPAAATAAADAPAKPASDADDKK